MKTPTWIFGLLRLGIVTLIYAHVQNRHDLLIAQPLLYYGLPMFMLLAVLGLHRHWMFALGTLLLCTSATELAPESLQVTSFRFIALGFVTFFLGFTPCDRDYSVRAWWNKDDDSFFEFKAAPDLTWNLYRAMVCLFYGRFFLAKTNPGYFEGNYFSRQLTATFSGADFLVQPWFSVLCVSLALLFFVLNAGFALAVWFPRAFPAFIALAVPFHLTYLGLTGLRDMTHFIFLLLLLPFAAYPQAQVKTPNVLTYT